MDSDICRIYVLSCANACARFVWTPHMLCFQYKRCFDRSTLSRNLSFSLDLSLSPTMSATGSATLRLGVLLHRYNGEQIQDGWQIQNFQDRVYQNTFFNWKQSMCGTQTKRAQHAEKWTDIIRPLEIALYVEIRLILHISLVIHLQKWNL